MEGLILAHMDLIQAVYRVYKARDRTKFFWIEHWMAMLESTGLLSEVTGLTNYSAKLIYCWSQLAVTDELRRRQRSVSLAFFDFIEGLARLAEFISPPSPADLRAFYEATGPPETAFPVAEYYQRMAWERPEVQTSARRPSAGLHGSESATRPLADKFSAFMELFLEGLKHAWGGSNEAQVIKRMTAMAKMLGGGMELD